MINAAPESVWFVHTDNNRDYLTWDEKEVKGFQAHGHVCQQYHHHCTVDALQQEQVTLQICFDKVVKERDEQKAENARLAGELEKSDRALKALMRTSFRLEEERDAARAENERLMADLSFAKLAARYEADLAQQAIAELAKAREDLRDEQKDGAIVWNVARQLVPDWHKFVVLLNTERNKQPEPNDE